MTTTTQPSRGRSCLLLIAAAIAIGLILGVTLAVLSDGDQTGRTGGPLAESTAQVACERTVKDQLGTSPAFQPGANWEIEGGWSIHGMLEADGQRMGYSCDVTGPEGSHRVTNVQIG